MKMMPDYLDLSNKEFVKLDVVPISVIDDIKTEIDNQYKWLMQTEHTLYDIDIAFDAIKSLLDKYIGKDKDETNN